MANECIDIPADIGEYLRYEIYTGELYWIKTYSNRVKAGDRAGWLDKTTGYRRVAFKGVKYQEHRIVWFMHHGEQPEITLDHENNIRDDNRPANLRNATYSEQIIWRPPVSKKSDLPQHVCKNGKGFKAGVRRDKKHNCLGTYDTPEEAHQAALDWIEAYNKAQD